MKVAIVTPWFGRELTGGAERLAWDLAFGLKERGCGVTIFSTCAQSFSDRWDRNTRAPGVAEFEGITISRFPADKSNTNRFHAINKKLLAFSRTDLRPGVRILDDIELRDFVGESINSTPLLTHLARHGGEYDAVFFLPYLYGLVLRGWRTVRDRAILVPCLHDEVYAYLPPVAEMMRGATRLCFNADSTIQLARSLYGPGIEPHSVVTGSGIVWPAADDGDRAQIGGFLPEETRYILYLGRRSPEKNTGLLVEAFERYTQFQPETTLKLVFAGSGDAVASPRATVLGSVSEAQKARLLRNALALAQPSTNESFSRVVMEAWASSRPVIINEACDATAVPLARTGAGWAARDTADWIRAFAEIDAQTPQQLRSIGLRAATYVKANARFENVLDKYVTVIEDVVGDRSRRTSAHGAALHVLDRAGYTDSATTLALQYSDLLRRQGIDSAVVASTVDERLGARVRRPTEADSSKPEISYTASATGGARIACSDASVTLHYGGVAAELPPWIDLRRWNVEPTPSVMTPLADGRTNILAVGPIAPRNHVMDIVNAFALYFAFDFDARLLLVGNKEDTAYAEAVYEAAERMGLEHRISISGEVSQPALAAMYRTAHLFVSFRERYTTGLTLLEAAAHGIPICALATTGARHALGGGGVLVTDPTDAQKLAALWKVLTTNAKFRNAVIESQRASYATRETAIFAALQSAIAAPVAG